MQPEDRLVLCCDGLWRKLPEQPMAMVVSSNTPTKVCAELIRLANEAGSEDNISVVVPSFMDRPFKENMQPPDDKEDSHHHSRWIIGQRITHQSVAATSDKYR
jgi:hypothetical protein